MKLLNLMYLLNFFVFCFLVFSRFLLLLVKNQKKTSRKPKKNKIARKHRENQKKQKKTKLQENIEKTKKNKKKTKLQDPLGTSW